MIELFFITALFTAGFLVIATANSLVRVIIGGEIVVLGAIFASAYSADLSMLAVAAGVGVAETLLFVATLFRLAKGAMYSEIFILITTLSVTLALLSARVGRAAAVASILVMFGFLAIERAYCSLYRI